MFCSVTKMIYDRGRSCEHVVALSRRCPSGEWGAGYGGERERKKVKGEILSKLGVGYDRGNEHDCRCAEVHALL